jgi:hypothetical protein
MALKQEFAKQIEAQLGVWQAQIKEHQQQMTQAGAEARSNYEKSIAMMQQNAEQAGKLLRQVQEANEKAWKDMQGATQKSLETLQKGWADAVSRFM